MVKKHENEKESGDDMLAEKVVQIQKKPSVKQIEKALELHKVKPINLTSSDEIAKDEEGDYFKEWYEEELRNIYNKH